ncbi:MAG: hypothetical protein CHACPFDD_03411 [Phycisphaerae bacterium]|nr:hypothetical protein [Phycisphaerae bacterium]
MIGICTPVRVTDERIAEVVRRLVEALHPQRIYLFGSHAYGTPHADSDVDLLVLVDDAELTQDDHDQRGYRSLRGMFLPIELHIRGRQAFERRAVAPHSFENEILRKGKLLYAA